MTPNTPPHRFTGRQAAAASCSRNSTVRTYSLLGGLFGNNKGSGMGAAGSKTQDDASPAGAREGWAPATGRCLHACLTKPQTLQPQLMSMAELGLSLLRRPCSAHVLSTTACLACSRLSGVPSSLLLPWQPQSPPPARCRAQALTSHHSQPSKRPRRRLSSQTSSGRWLVVCVCGLCVFSTGVPFTQD